MTHLTEEELIDILEGDRAFTHRNLGEGGHLAACDECRGRLADLQAVLGDAKQVSVPEPSPMFWPHFSRRVSAAIENESTPDHAWPAWLRWQVLLPLGAVAMIVLALMISVPKHEPVNEVVEIAAPIDVPADSWETVADLVGQIDLETASAAGVIEPGSADQAVLELTAEEQQELGRLLNAELTRAKS